MPDLLTVRKPLGQVLRHPRGEPERECVDEKQPYLATMVAVAVVIAFIPWIVYIVPYAYHLYTPP